MPDRPARHDHRIEAEEGETANKSLIEAVIGGDAHQAESLTKQAIDAGHDPRVLINEALVPAMDVVGERFSRGELYVPEMALAARAMERSLALLEPLLTSDENTMRGTIVIGTVKGDIHDVGKNLVVTMMRSSGFRVHDLGVDVPAERFVEAVLEYKPDILGLSALLTTTMSVMRTVIDAVETAGVRDSVQILVGGAPVTEEFALRIGADGYADDAGAAAERAKRIVSAV